MNNGANFIIFVFCVMVFVLYSQNIFIYLFILYLLSAFFYATANAGLFRPTSLKYLKCNELKIDNKG